MIKIKVKGERELDREVRRLSKALGLKGGEFADFAAKAVRDGVVRNVKPFGLGKKPGILGVKAVRRDLWRCFRPVSDAGVRRIGTIMSMGEAEAWHKSRRGSKGTVRRGERRRILSSVFRQYLNKIEGRVGMAKGSMLGGSDPRVRRKTSKVLGYAERWRGEGDARRKKNKSGAEWTFSGDPPHLASGNVLGERGVLKVQSLEKRLIYGSMKREMNKFLKKAQKSVNRGS